MPKKIPDNIKICSVEISLDGVEDTKRICVAVQGEWEHHHQGAFKITLQDMEQMVANFSNEERDVQFDYDHNCIWGNTKAAGWIQSLEIEEGKLYATVKWTASGQLAIDNKEYRYVSPVFQFDYKIPGTYKNVGTRLHSVALTNQPFLTELDPIVNNSQINKEESSMNEEQLKALIKELEGENKTLSNQNDALSKEVKALKDSVIQAEVDKYINSGVIEADQRETSIALASVDLDAFRKFADNMKQKTITNSVAAKVQQYITESKIYPAQKEFALSLTDEQLEAYVNSHPVENLRKNYVIEEGKHGGDYDPFLPDVED